MKNPARYPELSTGSYEFQGLHIASQKKGGAAQNTARPMTYACPHISEKRRDQEVVTSITEITDDVNCCQVVPSYTLVSNRKKLIQWMELNPNLLSIMFLSHLPPRISVPLKHPPAKRLWRQANLHNAARWWHDFPRLARTRRRPLLLHHQESLTRQRMRRTRNRRKTTSTIQLQVCILYTV